MKASDRPQLSAKWWDREHPAELKESDLGKALPKVEKALAEQQKKNEDLRAIDNCLAVLQAVPAAANKTIKQCDKRKHKDVITVLKKYDSLVKAEVTRLEGLKKKLADREGPGGDEDEEVSDDQLFEKDYLYKMMKLMKSAGKELRFGFGLNTNAPEASVLLLKRKGQPELLFKVLKKTKQFGNRLLTYGYAKADPEDGQTLIFRLEAGANEPPRILKLGRKFLRADKKLRFRRLKLIIGGRTLEDREPDTDDMGDEEGAPVAAGGGGEQQSEGLVEELTTVQSLLRTWEDTLQDVAVQVETLRGAIQEYDDPDTRSVYEGLGSVMDAFPVLDLTKLVDAARTDNRTTYEQTLDNTAGEIDQVRELLTNGPLLSTIDQNPFVSTDVHVKVNGVLNDIVAELGI